MSDISVGAVGATIIAGLVSLLGLIIGKEQKISEFRQVWIDELRKNIVAYLVHINAISDAIRSNKNDSAADKESLLASYKSLNEAHHSIILRLNPEEDASKAILDAMKDFDDIAKTNATLTPERLKATEEKFLKAAKDLLKFEWKRVKRGENVFVYTKRIVTSLVIVMVCLMAALWWFGKNSNSGYGRDSDEPLRFINHHSTLP